MERYARVSFWNGVAERAVKTAAQTFLALVGTATVFGAVDWPMVASAVGMASLLSVASSLAQPDHADTAVATYAPRHGATE